MISVVIVHWNQPTECAAAVRAFLGQGVPVEVLIVDNGSTPDNLAALSHVVPPARCLQVGSNIGFGPGANRGLAEVLRTSGADYIALAPHDALPSEGCLRRLCEALDRDPRAGAVSAEYGPGEGRRVSYTWVRGMLAAPGGPDLDPGWHEAFYPHGTLILFRRSCLTDAGLFDERYFAYAEEQDWGLRARRRGWRIGIYGGAVVRNPGRSAASAVVTYLNIRNSLLLVRDHSGFLPAVIRSAVVTLNTLILWSRSGPQRGLEARARTRALRDFWAGRFGPPPVGLGR